MYKRHVIFSNIIFLVVIGLAYKLNIDYSKIAEMAITVVSIALAVYIGATSMLLGSDYAKILKEIRDSEDNTRTNLGVLTTYLRRAGGFSISTLIVSCIYVLKIDWKPFASMIEDNHMSEFIFQTVSNVFSAISCGLFFVNIIFIWLILQFLINAIAKSTQCKKTK